jgi:hypothetical protein
VADVFLDLHGFYVHVRGDRAALDNVRRDFGFFESDPIMEPPALMLDLRREAALPPPQAARARLRTAECVGYDGSGLRFADYGGRATVACDFRLGRATIASVDDHLLHEASYMVILSRAGEALDRRGLHRVHSLAVARDGRATLCILPSGGGKTTLALALLRTGTVSVLSDEQALVDPGLRVLPFPLRLGLLPDEVASHGVPPKHVRVLERAARGPKALVDLDWFADAVTALPTPLASVLLGRRTGRERPELRRLSPTAAVGPLLVELVRARELPQTKVYFFRRDPRYLAMLARILVSRARRAVAIARQVACYRFELADDRARNASAFTEFLLQPRGS